MSLLSRLFRRNTVPRRYYLSLFEECEAAKAQTRNVTRQNELLIEKLSGKTEAIQSLAQRVRELEERLKGDEIELTSLRTNLGESAQRNISLSDRNTSLEAAVNQLTLDLGTVEKLNERFDKTIKDLEASNAVLQTSVDHHRATAENRAAIIEKRDEQVETLLRVVATVREHLSKVSHEVGLADLATRTVEDA